MLHIKLDKNSGKSVILIEGNILLLWVSLSLIHFINFSFSLTAEIFRVFQFRDNYVELNKDVASIEARCIIDTISTLELLKVLGEKFS